MEPVVGWSGPIGVLFSSLEEFSPRVDAGALVGAQHAFHAGDVGDGLDVLEVYPRWSAGVSSEGAEAGTKLWPSDGRER